MEYILKGDPAEVEKVIRENRIRVQRGVIQFIPVAPAGGSDSKAGIEADDKTPFVNDTKDVPAADAKEATSAKKTSRRSKKSE